MQCDQSSFAADEVCNNRMSKETKNGYLILLIKSNLLTIDNLVTNTHIENHFLSLVYKRAMCGVCCVFGFAFTRHENSRPEYCHTAEKT